MKGLGKYIGFGIWGCLLLTACKGDGTLLDLYPMEPIVNPEVGVLIGDNRIVHARLEGRYQISGITERGLFHTENRFKTFAFDPVQWRVGSTDATAFGDGMVVRAVMEGHTLVLFTSSDKGKVWSRFAGPVVDEDIQTQGPVYATRLWLQDNGTLWLLGQQHVGSDRHSLLYRVDLLEGRSELMLRRNHMRAVTLHGLRDGQVWVLTAALGQRQQVQLSSSTDGGRHWVEGAVISGVESPQLVVVDANRAIVYEGGGTARISTDRGVSFAAIDIDVLGVSQVVAASREVVYASTSSGVAKSIDGGQTWNILSTDVHGMQVVAPSLHFLDDRQGIVYGQDRLFLTNDGGENWEILLYPYPYVFD